MVVFTRAGAGCELGELRYTGAECSAELTGGAVEGGADCRPRPVLLSLPWPNHTTVHQMTPTQVAVDLCGGGCGGGINTACTPTAVRLVQVPVILGKCPVGAGKCAKVAN